MTYHELRNVLDRNAINTSSSIWGEKMLGYLCADIIYSEKPTIFRERSLRKTVSFEEKVMFNDKKPSILSKSITSSFSIGFKKQKTHIFQFSSRLSNRLRVSWKNMLWEKVRERRVVDMNKIIAFRKMCTETAINEQPALWRFGPKFHFVFNWSGTLYYWKYNCEIDQPKFIALWG